jgi:hypothetical protein
MSTKIVRGELDVADGKFLRGWMIMVNVAREIKSHQYILG